MLVLNLVPVDLLYSWEQLKWIFFNRLPAPPKRLDLTQEVLGTTQTEPRGPGTIQGGLGANAATRPAIGGIPRSARGRARARSRDLNLDSGKSLAISNIFFRKSSSRKSEKWVVRRIQFWIRQYNPFGRCSIPVTQSERGFFFKINFSNLRVRCPVQ